MSKMREFVKDDATREFARTRMTQAERDEIRKELADALMAMTQAGREKLFENASAEAFGAVFMTIFSELDKTEGLMEWAMTQVVFEDLMGKQVEKMVPTPEQIAAVFETALTA